LIPGGDEKIGKGALLKRTAQFLTEMVEKVDTIDDERSKWEMEKAHLEVGLPIRLSACRGLRAQYIARRFSLQ